MHAKKGLHLAMPIKGKQGSNKEYSKFSWTHNL